MKFLKRFKKIGVDQLPRNIEVVDLFCGRGNGLKSLEMLGFKHLSGVDCSPNLLKQYSGDAKLYVADCRALRFEAESKDLVTDQGGLHHLSLLPADLNKVLREATRILAVVGRESPLGYISRLTSYGTSAGRRND